MISKGNRLNGQPIHFQNEVVNSLVRVPLDGNYFNEQWIQRLICENPSILPVNEIERSFSPLLSIGREIVTPVGYIDNLFISPDGYITIVETKLWRNSEARREVVGQIIDYAKELSKWTFTDLDNAVRNYNRRNNNVNGLLETMSAQIELDAAEKQILIDVISKNLKKGRFLLLIVGDGIRESVEEMIDYLNRTQQLLFTLSLIELQVFKLDDEKKSLIIIPQIVVRTKEITRSIIRIEGNYPIELKVEVENDLAVDVPNSKIVNISTEEYFIRLLKSTNQETVDFAKRIIKDCESKRYIIDWNSGSFAVKLPDPKGSSGKISLFNIDKVGMVYLGYSREQLIRLDIPVELSYNFARDTAEVLPNVEYNTQTQNSWTKYSTLKELNPVYETFMGILDKYVSEIKLAGRQPTQ